MKKMANRQPMSYKAIHTNALYRLMILKNIVNLITNQKEIIQ